MDKSKFFNYRAVTVKFKKDMKLSNRQKQLFVIAVLYFSLPVVCSAQWYGGWGGFGFGQGWGYFPQLDLSLGKVQLSADNNYDGVVDLGASPNVKRNPPGLQIGKSEMSRVDISVIHNAALQTSNDSPKLKFNYYKTEVILDLRPVNLAHRRGRFRSFEEEQARSGRVRVWLDENRTKLLLDSADEQRRRVVWAASSSLPPKHVYVEGVSVGDSGTVMMFTLLLDNNNLGPLADKLFGDKAAWDALMFTVWPKVFDKPYVDNSPVWKLVR